MKRLLCGVAVLFFSLIGAARAETLSDHQVQSVEEKLRIFFMNKGMPMASLGWATQAILHNETTACNKYASDLLTEENTSSEVLDNAIAACTKNFVPAAAALAQSSCQDNWRACKDNADLINHWHDLYKVQTACKEKGQSLALYGQSQWGRDGWLSGFPFASYKPEDDTPQSGLLDLFEKNVGLQNQYGTTVHRQAMCMYNLNKMKIISLSILPDENAPGGVGGEELIRSYADPTAGLAPPRYR